MNRYKLPEIDADRLLIVRVAGDEASAGLAFAQFASRVTSVFGGALHDVAFRILQRMIAYGRGSELHHKLISVIAVPIELSVQSLYFLGGIFTGLLIIPVSLLLIPFGTEAVLFGPFLELSVEVAPPGTWTIVQFNPSSRSAGLFHSAAYADKRVLEVIARWARDIMSTHAGP
jgi:hypothetical protein